MKRYMILLAACASSLLISACEPEAEETMATSGVITGTVSYRERIALPPTATLEVALEDVSRADAKAIVLAIKQMDIEGSVPIDFELEYDPSAIDERMSYAIRARIEDQGKLLFINDTSTPVLTRDAGTEVEMILVSAGGEQKRERRRDAQGMVLRGMFQYMADAPLFTDCKSGESYPVAMKGAYIELERAYLNSGVEPGSKVLAEFTGRILQRPGMVQEGSNINVLVDSFKAIYPGEGCDMEALATLENTRWKLLEVGGKKVTADDTTKEPHMTLRANEKQVQGNAGCNNFFGPYEVEQDSLSFGNLGATMMACPSGMETEQAFLQALGSTQRYQISGEVLSLFSEDGEVARFSALYLD